MSAALAGRAVGLVIVGTLTWMVAANGLALPAGATLGMLHLIDLVFHEAGHVIFGFFGRFIAVLGGSLTQVLVPVVCTAAFVVKRQPAAAAVALTWTGQSLADVAVYVGDGKAMALPLLAEGLIHDWNYILGTLGWLDHAARLGQLTLALGVLTMTGGLVVLALDFWAACSTQAAAQDPAASHSSVDSARGSRVD